jgi:DNA-binding transcriptional regulator LsrR (DeoR family)
VPSHEVVQLEGGLEVVVVTHPKQVRAHLAGRDGWQATSALLPAPAHQL